MLFVLSIFIIILLSFDNTDNNGITSILGDTI